METSTVLIANPASREKKAEKVEEIVLALESVLRARGQCYLMMNVHRSCLEEVKNVLPGLSGPTVMEVASRGEDLVAVHAVVSEERVYQPDQPPETGRGEGYPGDVDRADGPLSRL